MLCWMDFHPTGLIGKPVSGGIHSAEFHRVVGTNEKVRELSVNPSMGITEADFASNHLLVVAVQHSTVVVRVRC